MIKTTPYKPGYHFMVGTESLDINKIILVHSPIGSGLVPNYETKEEALEEFVDRAQDLQ